MVAAFSLSDNSARHFIKQIAIVLLFTLAFTTRCRLGEKSANGFSGSAPIKDSVLAQNLSHVWEITWGPDNFIWMTERGGRVSRVNPVTGAVIPLLTIPDVSSNGEGGLLGLALHPNFSATPQVFVAYNYSREGNYREKIVRYTFNGSTLTQPVTLLDNIMASSIHNGCRLLISPERKLFITTGDAANPGSFPQDISALNGKILRLNLDGSIPADNPFPGNPVWTYGHRNPQGLVIANNIMYSSEHGPSNDDEINIIEKGRNYGWPQVEGFCNTGNEKRFCASRNVQEPIRAWTPTIAPCGLDYYNKDEIPQWKNSLLLLTLKNARLYQLKLDSSHRSVIQANEYFTNKYGRLRDLCISPAGKVYIGTSNGRDDKIIVVSGR